MVRYKSHDLPICAQWALLAGQGKVQRDILLEKARQAPQPYKSMYVKWARDWNHRIIINIREAKVAHEKYGA